MKEWKGMFTENAIIRLNQIDWDKIGQNGHRDDIELGTEFLKRMAKFCKKNNVKPMLPFLIDIPALLGKNTINSTLLEQCNDSVKKIIKNPSFATSIVNYYLRACILADEQEKYIDCIDIYEPIIVLFEKGGYFFYRERGMSFMNSGLIPLSNWLEKFST